MPKYTKIKKMGHGDSRKKNKLVVCKNLSEKEFLQDSNYLLYELD